jgi:acetyl/propionyl-CoA carboxylase alpha subunit
MSLFQKVMVANRGEIAVRIIRACKELGIPTVTVYTEQDANALHISKADQAILVSPGPVAGYLDYAQIIEVAKWAGADAIHPGYGFGAENWQFAQECADAGFTFIGPPPEAMRRMGDKVLARELAVEAGLPTVPGSPVIDTQDQAKEWAARIGFPMLLKAKGGGGGRGMRRVNTEEELLNSLEGASREARRTSKSRSWATSTATSSTWASGTVPSSAATRRSSRSRPPWSSPRKSAWRWGSWPRRPRPSWATIPWAPWNSWWTRT